MKQAREIFVYCLAVVIYLGYFTLIGCILFKVVPIENKDLARSLFDTITVIVVLVTKFFYDGNKETAVKNEMLYRSTPPVNPEAKAPTKEPEQA